MPAIRLTADEVYAMRVEDGTYASILNQMLEIGPDCIADATYGIDFVKATKEENDNSLHIKYDDDEVDGKTFTTVIVGEVCPASMGTRISAVGTQFTGPGAKPITDQTNVKDRIDLRNLTYAQDDLMTLFNNQVATLGEWRELEEQEEKEEGIIPAVVKEAIHVDPNMPNGPANIISVTLDPKYKACITSQPMDPSSAKKTEAANGTAKAPRIVKQHIKRPTDSDDEPTAAAQEKDKDVDADGTDEVLNKGFKIELGAFYPPSLLPDYGGPFFQHQKNKLVQLDIRDIDNNLVAPWDLYDKLRPGTVVLVVATLVVWVMNEIEGNPDTPLKKYYHVCGHSVRVLAESGEAIEERKIPTLGGKKGRASGRSTPTRNSAALKAFESFESPSKRARRD